MIKPLKPVSLRALSTVLLMVLMSLCVFTTAGCGEKASDVCKIRIGLIPTDDNTLFYVADFENLFAEAGLDVTFVEFLSAPERDAALQAKQIDGEITDLMTVALRKKAGIDVAILTLCLGATPAEGPFSLISSPNSGITAPEDLKGASIGIAENTIVEYVTVRLLDSVGIAPEDCNIVYVTKIPDRLNMVMQDTLAAGTFPEPQSSYAVSQGCIRVIDDTREDISQTVFFLTRDLLNTYPDEIRTLMAVLSQAQRIYMDNPENYRSLITKRVNVPANLTDTYTLPTFSPPQPPLKSNFDDVMTWMTEKGILAQPYAYDSLVDTTFFN
ncbi:MAG: MetQ/NlpA family ABC transporter substrate-binding protein [Peptococcaceae bacterium]|nr:MetQ/NlpA family ABC transporter substrate-binding protein [Peptococcaceae bacterium]